MKNYKISLMILKILIGQILKRFQLKKKRILKSKTLIRSFKNSKRILSVQIR